MLSWLIFNRSMSFTVCICHSLIDSTILSVCLSMVFYIKVLWSSSSYPFSEWCPLYAVCSLRTFYTSDIPEQTIRKCQQHLSLLQWWVRKIKSSKSLFAINDTLKAHLFFLKGHLIHWCCVDISLKISSWAASLKCSLTDAMTWSTSSSLYVGQLDEAFQFIWTIWHCFTCYNHE